MAGDYIRREDALSAILAEPPDAHYPAWYASALMALPAADVAEVVYCKDCKYVIFTEHRDYLRCTKHVAFSFRPNDFCSYGERREK